MLSRQELDSRRGKRKFKSYKIASGGEVNFRTMMGRERRTWRTFHRKPDGTTDQVKLDYSDDVLLALSMCDDEGNPMYSVEDALAGCFDEYDSPDLGSLLEAAVEINGIGKSVGAEPALKNSEGTQKSDSSGGSSGTATAT